MEKITIERKEAPLHRLSPSITSISLYLSLNLSALLQDLKRKWKYKRKKEEEHLHYTTLEDRKLSLNPNLLSFWPNPAIFIGKRRFQKMRRGHTSKIDVWPHHLVVKTRLLLSFHGNTRDLGPWFWLFIFSLIDYFHECAIHMILVHSHFFVYSWLCFMSIFLSFIYFECQLLCI